MGGVNPAPRTGRFALLRHETPPGYARPSHWDFLLEREDALATWALLKLPRPGESVAAERLPDHRVAYLEYEGPVRGDRGSLRRIDSGRYETLSDSPTCWEFQLFATHHSGRWRLEMESSPEVWRVTWAGRTQCPVR